MKKNALVIYLQEQKKENTSELIWSIRNFNSQDFSLLGPVSLWDLTEPPAAHVVELCAEEESGQNVDHWENDPEDCVSFPKHL